MKLMNGQWWYVICTVVGSVHAHYLSLEKIEKSKRFQKDSLVSRAELDQKLAEFARLHQLNEKEQKYVSI